jgi:hypothetical protein
LRLRRKKSPKTSIFAQINSKFSINTCFELRFSDNNYYLVEKKAGKIEKKKKKKKKRWDANLDSRFFDRFFCRKNL